MISSVLVRGVAMEEVRAALTVVGKLLLTERTTNLTLISWLLPTRMAGWSWSCDGRISMMILKHLYKTKTHYYLFCTCQSTLWCPVSALEQSSCMFGTLFQTEELEAEASREPEKQLNIELTTLRVHKLNRTFVNEMCCSRNILLRRSPTVGSLRFGSCSTNSWTKNSCSTPNGRLHKFRRASVYTQY